MRHDGHGAVRLFFYNGWDLHRLDAAVRSARRHNIYLTITLDDAIGGCGENDKDATWFADQSERDTYRTHMQTLLQRYRGDTTFAWFEFFNEPDDENGALRAFYDEMGTTADTIDPDRLFSSGTVAPYWVDGEANFLDIHQSPAVDIASLHEYDENVSESNHGPRVRANSAGKPVIVGEFGIEVCDDAFDSRAERFADKAEVYTDTGIGYAGALAWAWQPGGGGCELGNLDEDTATRRSCGPTGSAPSPRSPARPARSPWSPPRRRPARSPARPPARPLVGSPGRRPARSPSAPPAGRPAASPATPRARRPTRSRSAPRRDPEPDAGRGAGREPRRGAGRDALRGPGSGTRTRSRAAHPRSRPPPTPAPPPSAPRCRARSTWCGSRSRPRSAAASRPRRPPREGPTPSDDADGRAGPAG